MSPAKRTRGALAAAAAQAQAQAQSESGAQIDISDDDNKKTERSNRSKKHKVKNTSGDKAVLERDANSENGSSKGKDKTEENAEGNDVQVNGEEHGQESGKVEVRDSSRRSRNASAKGRDVEEGFVGEPVPKDEAKSKWPWRFQKKQKKEDDEVEKVQAKAHYLKANVDGIMYHLDDTVFVKGEDGGPDYVGKIIEFFEGVDDNKYFCSRWFYRAEDTAIKTESSFHDKKRVFYSQITDDNLLECIVKKISVVQVPPLIHGKKRFIPPCDFYYDMGYDLAYTTFHNLSVENPSSSTETTSTVCNDSDSSRDSGTDCKTKSDDKSPPLSLLDLYSGCGGMSTGLCLGANLAGVNLVTKWAVDMNEHACKSLKHNHPETEVRNETADDFLALLKKWQELCKKYCEPEDCKINNSPSDKAHNRTEVTKSEENEEGDDDSDLSEGEFEVETLLGIRHREPTKENKSGIQFKVRWKGYDEDEDSWEPMEGLESAEEKIKEFIKTNAKAKILPLPGDVDVVCGGPPCQGASGFNRFRNREAPLDDPKNHQVVVYMDIVNYLRPRFVLMENVVDILKFAGGILGRYALSRLVHMNYQAKLGMMAAGCYGLPQFRMRVFLWGASTTENLPKYPLPTHDVIVRGTVPSEWERNVVAYDELEPRKLQKKLLLGDAISDLPPVTNDEKRDEMPYGTTPRTDFQKYIRLPKEAMKGDNTSSLSSASKKKQAILYDHRPLNLNEDDFQRVCRIPKKKGANFRDLPGVRVKEDNVVELDPSMERVLLPSGKPLVPDYAITFVGGRSSKPFGRLWWDETVPTVVTRAEPHNQAIMHPVQDRVLSIRENARLQGFPDFYKLYGNVKDRYIQVGNAVAVPVARALGYALGVAVKTLVTDNSPVMELSPGFPQRVDQPSDAAAIEAGVSDEGEGI